MNDTRIKLLQGNIATMRKRVPSEVDKAKLRDRIKLSEAMLRDELAKGKATP